MTVTVTVTGPMPDGKPHVIENVFHADTVHSCPLLSVTKPEPKVAKFWPAMIAVVVPSGRGASTCTDDCEKVMPVMIGAE